MANWREIIISGSDAELNKLNVDSSLTASGLIYPAADGSNTQVLQTDGSGNLSFADKDSGPQGTTGAQGAQGLDGDLGSKGDIGEKGINGEKGEQGPTGAQGADGAQGVQGEEGQKGEGGAQGTVGEKGAQGTTGGPGVVGPKGEKGDIGSQGVDGAQGADGAQGETGVQGNDGSFGGATFDYTFSTDTAGGNDPGQGIVELNSTQQNTADEIYIDSSSVVGSIGVISTGFGLDQLINKHGIERRVHTA